MPGCFFSDLGVNILRNMMVRCVENIVNIYVFLKLQVFNFFDILGSSGTAWDLILGLFGARGRILVIREGAGNILQYCYPGNSAGWGGSQSLGNEQM